MMSKPPKSGPSSDIEAVDQSRAEQGKSDPQKGTAQDIEKSDEQVVGRPEHHSTRK